MSGELDVVRPLKFTQLKAGPIYNLIAVNIYAKDMFHLKTNFTERQAMELFKDERNYGYLTNPVLSLGKLHDAIVDEEGFVKALLALG